MTDRKVTRAVLNDWILNDGLEQLFREGYLSIDVVDPADPQLVGAVGVAHSLFKQYLQAENKVQSLVDEACG